MLPNSAGAGSGAAAKNTDWLRKAAEQGYPDAMFRLGEVLLEGRGVERDEREADRWIRKAARKGNRKARALLKSRGGSGR